MLSKQQIRADFRAIRRQIPSSYSREAANATVSHLVQQVVFQESYHIACYVAHLAELDSHLLIEKIWQTNKKCYLPKLTQENRLQFVLFQPNEKLKPNQYGILEPVASAEKISPEQLDLVIVPLVAFDLLGHRLGAGGGYYDRTFQFKQNAKNKNPFLLGFAYAAQQALLLPFDEWDVLLDGVVTEKEWIVCGKT